MEPTDFEYGERQYRAEDPAGHQWTFSQTLADVAPEEWGGGVGRPVMDGIDPDRLADALRVLAEVEELPHRASRRGRGPARRRQAVQDGQGAAAGRATRRGPRPRRGGDRRDGDRRARADRRRDPGAAAALARDRARRPGTLTAPARVLRLQAALPRRRRVLPPALPVLRRAQPRAPRRAHRPERTPRAAHRRPGEDRDVHRAAPAARRRPHDDHDALPRAMRSGGSPRWRTAPTGSTACASSASTCATPARSSRSPTTSPPQGPLDILINNAAQTVRRSPEAYAHLAAAAQAPLPSGPLPEVVTLGRAGDAPPRADGHWSPTPQALTALALTAGSARPSASPPAPRSTPAVSRPTCTRTTAGARCVDEVDPVELLEVQLCNQTAPFILISRLRPALAASTARRTYVVNVSAMEGQFSPRLQGRPATRTRTWPRPR